MGLEGAAPSQAAGAKWSLAQFGLACVSPTPPPSTGPRALWFHLSSGHHPGRENPGRLGPPAVF